MNVGKSPKKPLMYYYSIVILILAIINLILVPTITSSKIEEVDYSTFMQMTEEKQINEVQINNREILVELKDYMILAQNLHKQLRKKNHLG